MKFQTFLSILQRVDAFFVIFQKTRFSFNKGNLRDFEGKMSGNGQNFYGHQLRDGFIRDTIVSGPPIVPLEIAEGHDFQKNCVP